MMDQDMLFRGGLMLAVLLLAGVFGASLGERMKEDPLVEMEGVFSELVTMITTLHQQDPGSSITVYFGELSGMEGGLFALPSKLDGHHFKIQLGQGLLTMRTDGNMMSFAFGQWFIPAMPPSGSTLISPSHYRNISRTVGGYTISTPAVLKLVRPNICKNGEVFIYPEGLENVTSPSGVEDLQVLILESGVISPGWKAEAIVECSDILAYEDPVLLINMVCPSLISGSCPLPLMLPADLGVDPALFHSGSGSIRFYKEIMMGDDGIMFFRTGSEPG